MNFLKTDKLPTYSTTFYYLQKIPGVARFITAKDIPGENNTMQMNFWPIKIVEPVSFTCVSCRYCEKIH